MAGLALAYGDEALSAFDLAFHRGDGLHRARLGGCWNVRFEDIEPVREFNWAKGGESFAGLYYSMMMGDHVGYESWLGRALAQAGRHRSPVCREPS